MDVRLWIWWKLLLLRQWTDWSGCQGKLAIIYMEDYQIRAISTSPYQLKQCFWYIEDSESKCKNNEAKPILYHLNSIEPGIIWFIIEKLENYEIAVLDVKQKVDKKSKSIQFSVNYKKTHININVDERFNHPEMMQRAIVKAFGDRARSWCDENNGKGELRNLEEIFTENRYT